MPRTCGTRAYTVTSESGAPHLVEVRRPRSKRLLRIDDARPYMAASPHVRVHASWGTHYVRQIPTNGSCRPATQAEFDAYTAHMEATSNAHVSCCNGAVWKAIEGIGGVDPSEWLAVRDERPWQFNFDEALDLLLSDEAWAATEATRPRRTRVLTF